MHDRVCSSFFICLHMKQAAKLTWLPLINYNLHIYFIFTRSLVYSRSENKSTYLYTSNLASLYIYISWELLSLNCIGEMQVRSGSASCCSIIWLYKLFYQCVTKINNVLTSRRFITLTIPVINFQQTLILIIEFGHCHIEFIQSVRNSIENWSLINVKNYYISKT